MNKTARKLTAVGLCAVLCLSGVGAAFAQTTAKTESKSEKKTQSETNAEVSKNETVYVLAGADGSVQKIIVSDWIQNAAGSDRVFDKSDLSNIENVKGDEGYTLDGDNMTVWDAKGNDIYYQGNLEKELPVNMTVSYQLDGKSISAEQLVGKSGKVTIRFDYRNNQFETVQIDGKEEKIYVPFAMLTGMMLDSDTFRNVQVTNGKLLNDGDRTVVIGLAFPGLQENLNIDKETLEIPDYVQITADVTDFSLGMTVTVATNEIFNELDADNIDLSELNDSLGALTDAVSQLLDGSSALYDGLCTLLEKADELIAGVKELAQGAKNLKDGADQLAIGAGKLSAGLDALSSNSAALNGGAAQVFNTLLANATAQIRGAGLSVPDLTIENYAQVLDGVIASLTQAGATEASQMIAELKASLDSYNDFYLGLLAYTGGVDEAATGAGTLKTGTDELKLGADRLYDGILTLQDGMPALVSGVTQLRDGAMSLNEGMKQLNEQGIQKLAKLVDEDLGSLAVRLRATVDVSKHYTNFSGIADDMDGQVKFIYRTEQIKGN